MSGERRLLELVGDMYGLLDLDEFRHGLIAALPRAVRCDWVSINEIGPQPGDHWEMVEPPLPAEAHELFGRYMHQNPLIAYMTDSARRGAAVRLSDVSSRREFHALEIYRKLYGPLGLEHQIAFTLPQEPPRLLGVALSRRRRDFSDAERALLNRARPFLIQGYRSAIALDRERESGARGLVGALRAAGLTQREAEVTSLLARGLSNADLAAALGISKRTAEAHVQRVFAKLGLGSRSRVAAYAWHLVGDDLRSAS